MQAVSRRHGMRMGTLAGAALVLFLAGCDQTPSVVKIGVAQPLSGDLAHEGQDMLNGVRLAVAELNKQGFKIKGKPVTLEVVAGDDRADAQTGKDVAKQLIDAGVVAVIGDLNSGVSIAAAPLYAAHNIAQLAISTNPKFTQLGLPTTFRLVANDTLQAKALGSYAAGSLNAKKIAVLDDSTPYGKDLADGVVAQLKVASKGVALRQSLDNKTTAFDDLAQRIKAAGIDTIITTLADFQDMALLTALKKIDYTTVTMMGSDTMKTTNMLKGEGMVQALYASSPILEVREFPAGPAFLDAYRAAYKVDPAYGGHYSYDATYVVAAAMQRAESASPKDITATLRGIDAYAPVTGSMKFDAQGEQRYGVISVYAAHDGRWESQVRSDSW